MVSLPKSKNLFKHLTAYTCNTTKIQFKKCSLHLCNGSSIASAATVFIILITFNNSRYAYTAYYAIQLMTIFYCISLPSLDEFVPFHLEKKMLVVIEIPSHSIATRSEFNSTPLK